MVCYPPKIEPVNPSYTRGFYKSHERSREPDRFRKEAVSDEDFDQRTLDEIDRVTDQIFIHLHSFADRLKRSEIEAAIAAKNSSTTKKSPFLGYKSNNSHRLRPFRRETNFYEQEDPEQAVRSKHVVWKILTTLGKIFFGYEFIESHQDDSTPDQMIKALKIDSVIWYQELKKHYTHNFKCKVNQAFHQAGELLKNRRAYAKEAYYQRIALYALLVFSLIAKLSNHRVFTILGLGTSSITLIYMLIRYGTTSLSRAQLSSDLKWTVEIAEKEALNNRLLSNPLQPQYIFS